MKTSHGEGIVIDVQILTQLISIRTDDGTVFAVPVEEIEILKMPTKQQEIEEQDEIDPIDMEDLGDDNDKPQQDDKPDEKTEQ